MWIIILLSMLFLHIVDDYYLQGILAKLKQKQWWDKNAPNYLYRYDYVIALIEHGFSWSFMIHVPIIFFMIVNNYYLTILLILTVGINTIIHCIIDDLKANKLIINLTQDQMFHIIQVIFTWIIYYQMKG